MDKDVAEKFRALDVSAHIQAETINNAVQDNAIQGTAVISNNLFQQLGGPSSVPGLLASAQTAAGVPAQGMR